MKNKPGKLLKTIGSTLLLFSILLTVLVPQNVYAEELPTPGAQGFKYLYTLMHHYGEEDPDWLDDAKYEAVDVLVDGESVPGQIVVTMSNITDMPTADCEVRVGLIELVPRYRTCEYCGTPFLRVNKRCSHCERANSQIAVLNGGLLRFGGRYGQPIVNRTITFTIPANHRASISFTVRRGGPDSEWGQCYSACNIFEDGNMEILNLESDYGIVYKTGTYKTEIITLYDCRSETGKDAWITGEYLLAVDRLGYTKNTQTTTEEKKAPTIDVSAVFSSADYAALNPDLAAAGIVSEEQLKNHFLLCGMKEGRTASKDFVLEVYKAKNPDLFSAFGHDNISYYMHYINCGKAENRIAK